jgi:hypothetical protein
VGETSGLLHREEPRLRMTPSRSQIEFSDDNLSLRTKSAVTKSQETRAPRIDKGNLQLSLRVEP